MTKIAIVMEYWDEDDLARDKPFSSARTAIAASQLRAVGIDIKHCLVTAVINKAGTDFENFCGPKTEGIPGEPLVGANKYLRKEFANDLAEFRQRVRSFAPNVIIALGGGAAWAVTGSSKLKSYRGTPIATPLGKCISTYAPQALNGEYKLLPIFLADLGKAKRESAYPEVIRPSRFIHVEPTLADLCDWSPVLNGSDMLSVDIETISPQITCVGFAPDEHSAYVVPFVASGYPGNNYWPTLSEELTAWRYVRQWCLNAKRVVGQNFNYDMGYLWKTYGIALPNASDDTMLLHHAMQIEMEKGLGFLGSIYTDEPSWKLMRANRDTIKKED